MTSATEAAEVEDRFTNIDNRRKEVPAARCLLKEIGQETGKSINILRGKKLYLGAQIRRARHRQEVKKGFKGMKTV